jgi:TolB-like protein/class 3 adenylate cyclase/cytochrome c-type biogenesis protein CcmH/NrfG
MKDDTNSAVHLETRRLAAIMFTDIVGFSRQMGTDEARMLRLLEVHNQLIQQAVSEHHGTVIKTVGDAFLIEFPSVVHAVQCAQQGHVQLRAHNAEKEKADQIHVRIGIHLGDIVQRDGDVFGDGVNIASRLQSLAEPDTICLSQKVYEEVAKKLDLGTVVSLGKPKLKNIAERFAVYALLSAPPKGIRQTLGVQYLKLSRRVGTAHRVAAMVVLLALVSAGAIAIRERYFSAPPGLPLPDKPSIVVLPFDNMSNDPSQDYFSDGITEDITTDLSKIASLFVISRNSAFTYKGKAANIRDVGRELGVRYVLEGSVRRSDNQVRITAQLIDAIQGQHLWSERYDRPLQDIFAVQDDIRQQIVFALKVKLTPEEQARFKNAPTNNLEAYNYYLRGWQLFLRTTRETNIQARQLFEKAIALDPQYAGAYAGLGATYWIEWLSQWNADPQNLARAEEMIQQAIVLDESLARAHAGLGFLKMFQKQYEQATAEVDRALALDPNSANGYRILAYVLMVVGRTEEAVEAAKKAVRLDPRQVQPLKALGEAYWHAGQYEEAIPVLKQVLTYTPSDWLVYWGLAVSYSELGREEEARAAGAEMLRLVPHFSVEKWRPMAPYKDPAVTERIAAAARKAGLK